MTLKKLEDISMKYIYLLLILLIPVFSNGFAQNSDQNYICTRLMLHERDTSKYIETVQYYDGLGRPFMKVQKGITPNHSNLVTLQEYDDFGREARSWLPQATTSDYLDPVSFKSSVSDFYNGDTRPYTDLVYESSPLNRIIQQHTPGDAWSSHPTFTSYLTNTASGELSCKLYRITSSGALTQDNIYPPGTLYVTKSIDEDGNVLYVFTDIQERKILTRQMLGAMPHDTYYVYDYFDNKCFVLPPAYQKNPDLGLYAYQYKYDERNRCIEKKIPGCEPTTYIYDYADHLIFSQDGVQRGQSEWTFYLYDAFHRLTVKGICKNTNVSVVKKTIVKCTMRENLYDMEISTNLGSSGYKTNLNLVSPVVHEIDYYDNYSFLSLNAYSGKERFHAPTVNSIGYSTGRIVALFDKEISYLFSATYYDIKGRPTEVVSDNHTGGYDIKTITYSFTGNPIKVHYAHTPNGAPRNEEYTYAYDHADRLIKTTHQLAGCLPIVLSEKTYDNLGRLATKKYHGTIENTSYTYDIRNSLTNIVSRSFGEQLGYTPGGNISRMDWHSSNNSDINSYQFAYDGLNRLKKATYQNYWQPRNSLLTSEPDYSTEYGYDMNGNITNLSRHGHKRDNIYYGIIDNLTATYNGNQLKSTSDPESGGPFNGVFEFDDSHKGGGTEYFYDSNGNLTQDYDKNISLIQYNSLNLPKSLQFNNGNTINYLYSADGHKCKVIHQTAVSNIMITMGPTLPLAPVQVLDSIKTEYCGNVIYENDELSKVLTDEGYITFEENIPTYHYYLRDHLGHNRIVVNQTGTVEEVNDYYPFGGILSNVAGFSGVQAFKYGGKELDRMHKLDWYDFGNRFYRPDLPTWTGIDPLCEKYYSISPYVYCHNNPMNRIDIDGKWDVHVHVYNKRSQYGYGVAVVTDRNSKEIYRFNVRAEGVKGRNRFKTGADTPLGIYDIPDNQPWLVGGSRLSYGPNARLNMDGKSGEIVTSGRSAIRIHGGRQEAYNSETENWTPVKNPALKKTYGCLRAYDTDIATFYQITTELQITDEKEMPGEVVIRDDLERVLVPSKDNSVGFDAEYKVPEKKQNYWELFIGTLINNLNIKW